jgi:hypothetical protein
MPQLRVTNHQASSSSPTQTTIASPKKLVFHIILRRWPHHGCKICPTMATDNIALWKSLKPNSQKKGDTRTNPIWRGLNSTNVLDEGLRIGETGRRMNSKVNSVKQGGYDSKHGCRTWLAFNLSHNVPSWPLYIGGQISRIGWDPIQITISTYDMNSYFD